MQSFVRFLSTTLKFARVKIYSKKSRNIFSTNKDYCADGNPSCPIQLDRQILEAVIDPSPLFSGFFSFFLHNDVSSPISFLIFDCDFMNLRGRRTIYELFQVSNFRLQLIEYRGRKFAPPIVRPCCQSLGGPNLQQAPSIISI